MVRRLAVLLCLFSAVPRGAWAAVARESDAPSGAAPVIAPVPVPVSIPAMDAPLEAADAAAAPFETGSATSLSAAPSALSAAVGGGASARSQKTAASDSLLAPDQRAAEEDGRVLFDGAAGADRLRSTGPGPGALVPESSPRLAASGSAKPGGSPRPPAPKTGAFLAGVFGNQVANNALNVTLPLALLSVGQSVSSALMLTAFTTAFDMGGTLVGGWLMGRLSARAALASTAAVRAAALGGAAALLAAGAATAPLLVGLFSLDALARGVADTARNTAAVSIVGKDPAALARLNGSSQTAFYAGGIAGPLATIPLLALPGLWAHWFVAGGFALASAAFLAMPRAAAPRTAPSTPAGPGGSGPWYRDRAVLAGVAALVLASLLPALRAQLPVLFAEGVMHAAAEAAKLALAFGLGSTAGSLAYRRWHERLSSSRWLLVGGLGTLALAAAWTAGAFLPLSAAVFAFAAASATAQLAATTALQSRLPSGAEGAAMGSARFGANLVSLLLRLAIPAVVAAAVSPVAALPWIGAGLAALGAAQLWLSGALPARAKRALAWTAAALGAAAAAKLGLPHDSLHLVAAGALAVAPAATAPPALSSASPVHGYPGRLIVVEGLDGSGKSTQLELLKQHLEAQGRKVVVTSWNSSDLIADAVKKAKRQQALTPRTFALMNAADFADRVEHVIKPALAEGAIVLADRWFYTALARDAVRGNDPAWLRGLYGDALKPDLALYFKLDTDTAISRVLARAGGKVGLSEDFDETDPRRKVLGQNYYAAGRDMRFADDDLENFRRFQSRVAAAYDAQIGEFGLRAMDAAKPRDVQQQAVLADVLGALGPLEAYKKAPPRSLSNVFDKDPAGDDEKLRRNYLRPKKGAHFYFRNMLLPMQERFAQLLDNDSMPRVFLHGSLHVDNYAKTENGAAMIDFDRSRVGPYAWDLVRLLVSLSLRQKKPVQGLLDPSVTKALRDGYTYGLEHPNRPFSEARLVKNVKPGKGERSMDDYLAHGGKWAREMRASPLRPDDADVAALVSSYAASRPR